MLNEVLTLNKSLNRCGVQIPTIHRWLQEHKRQEGFIVGISSDGQIVAIEYCASDRMAKIWKVMPDNQKSFPVINLKTPIWKTSISPMELRKQFDNKKEISARCDVMRQFCKNGALAYKKTEISKLKGRLCGYPSELLKELDVYSTAPDVIKTLIIRLQSFEHNPETFLNQISHMAISSCLSGDIDSVDLVESLLFGKWSKKRGEFGKGDIPIVLDLADYHKYVHRVTDPDLKQIVNDMLLQKIDDKPQQALCSLTGDKTTIELHKFPCPKLPVIGPTYLLSMNRDAPCHYRYGKISSAIFPVGKDLTQKLQNSLFYITDEKRRGKTWQKVPSTDSKKPDLLIVYLEEMPECAINLADLFVETAESEMSEAAFEETAKSVCSALKGMPALNKNSFVHIFVLTKIDPGRKQLALNSSFTVENVISGAEEWQFASHNHPPVVIILPGKKGEKAISATPSCPSPASTMRCFQHQWIRDGIANTRVPGCKLHEIYDIFLGNSPVAKRSAKRLLDLALKQLTPLFLGIGSAVWSGNWKPFSEHARNTTLTGVSILSVLLFKLGYRKEDYMKEAAFNVGKLLALADTLHKEYCNHVRKQDIPPQLIGNAMMPIAIDNPEQGIARLNVRLMIYKAWADKVHGEKYRLVKWTLNQMGQVANKLANCDLPNRTDDGAKAQILLGYLARSESKSSEA